MEVQVLSISIGRSITVMHSIWVRKITGSSPAALILAESHNGSVGACKALGKGSIPFSALKTSGRAVECGGFENHYTKYRGFESHLVQLLP